MRVIHDHTGSFDGKHSIPLDIVTGKSVHVWDGARWVQFLNRDRGKVPLEYVHKEEMSDWIIERARQLPTRRGLLVLVGHRPDYEPPPPLDMKGLPVFAKAFLSTSGRGEPDNVYRNRVGLYHDQRYQCYEEGALPREVWKGVPQEVRL